KDGLDACLREKPDLLVVDGTEPVHQVAEHFGIALPDSGAASFAGLLVERIGRIPSVGERFRISGLDIDVIEATPVRIRKMVVRPRTPAAVPIDREGA
ncbi:MAG TPA: transporter associated domain-containing protein, partial [Gemmatimonadales bacterium]|nr:transporter associated domain-containing protein [Gemmatimonadales bacterium]